MVAVAERPSVTLPWHRVTDQPYKASVPGLYFHRATDPVVLFGGAVGGSKTTTLATKCIYLSLQYDNNRGFVGERDFDDLRRGLYSEILSWLPENRKLADGRDLFQHNKAEHWLRFYNGSEIHFVELKDEPRNVNLGWAAIDQVERVPAQSFDWMQTRLRAPHIPYRPLLLSANPEPGWVKQMFVDDARPEHTGIMRRNGEELVVYRKPGGLLFVPAFPEDNEHLPADYVQGLYDRLPEHLVQRLLKGVWDVVENAVYPQLDRSKQFALIPERTRWEDGAIGIDYGRVHLSAVVAVSRDSTGVYWVRECWAESGGDPQPIEDAARSMKVRFNIGRGRVDPLQEFMAQKLNLNIANSGAGSRKARIGHVTKLLDANALKFDMDGHGVNELFNEMLAYRWEHRETATSLEAVPVRKNDDRVAALEDAIEELMEDTPLDSRITSQAVGYKPAPSSAARSSLIRIRRRGR